MFKREQIKIFKVLTLLNRSLNKFDRFYYVKKRKKERKNDITE